MYCIKSLFNLNVFLFLADWSFGSSPEGELVEYCSGEDFNPVCADDQIIVMENANYGHIKLGKCIDEDIGRLGCYLDQLSVLDRMCSGRHSCEVEFSDSLMDGEFPCTLSRSFARYLEASFLCRTVYIPNAGQCSSSVEVSATSRLNYLSSIITEKYGCGEETKPWLITAKEGQEISLTFVDFNWKVRTRDEATVKCPKKYGYIVDDATSDIVNLCGGLVRERNLYISKGNRLQILLATNVLNDVKFLIGYKAVGCPKYQASPDTWIEERDAYIIVGCVTTGQKWKMRCIGSHWLGPLKDCSQYASQEDHMRSAKSEQTEDHFLNMPPAVTFALFGGIILVLLSVITTVVIGVFCIRKSNKKSNRKSKDNVDYGQTIGKPQVLLPLDNFPTYKSVQVKLPKKAEIARGGGKSDDPFGSISTLPCLGSVPRHPPSLRESPHYYLLEGRDTTETEPLYDVVYQGLPSHTNG